MMKSTLKTVVTIASGAMLATVIGLLTMLLVGMLSWSLARGVNGIVIGLIASTVFAWFLRKKAAWPVSIVASGIGAMVACFFAISTAEILPPGSVQWMFKGGLYGAAFGIPFAAFLSPLALLETRRVNG